jgi:hypothetical protein
VRSGLSESDRQGGFVVERSERMLSIERFASRDKLRLAHWRSIRGEWVGKRRRVQLDLMISYDPNKAWTAHGRVSTRALGSSEGESLLLCGLLDHRRDDTQELRCSSHTRNDGDGDRCSVLAELDRGSSDGDRRERREQETGSTLGRRLYFQLLSAKGEEKSAHNLRLFALGSG